MNQEFLRKCSGSFTFQNGDVYEGEYMAHRFGVIWREGYGTYTTHDGQIYYGLWKDDKLMENSQINISYVNGAEYFGTLFKSKYKGPGVYKLENNLQLTCQFLDNQPTGQIILVDSTNHIWVGQAAKNKALLHHENIFYNAICPEKGIGKIKEKPKFIKQKSLKLKKNARHILTEDEIFAKSTKTLDDIDFTQSEWFQNFKKFNTTKDGIKAKIENEGIGNLNDTERKWWDAYQIYKKNKIKMEKRNKIIEDEEQKHVDTSLLEKYYSKEFRDSCPAVKVFYPSVDWDEYYDPSRMPEKSYVDYFDSETSIQTVKRIFKFFEKGGKYDMCVAAEEVFNEEI